MSVVLVKTYSELPIDKNEVLRYARCKNSDEQTLSLLEECICELKNKLTFKVCYTVEENGGCFFNSCSSMLGTYLSGCSKYVLFAATVGMEIDRLIAKYQKLSPSKAYMLQAIGAERVEALCDIFAKDIEREFSKTKPRISPGYSDLPLEMQREVFGILDCSRKIGITLNDSMFMSPSKSVTAFIGVI